MFQSQQFVRVQRRGPETVLLQFILLSVLFFVCMIGLIAFMHFSSANTSASVAAPVPSHSASGDLIEVIVPAETVDTGKLLDPAMFRRERRPAVAVGPEMVRDFEELKGLYSRGMLVKGQPIIRDLLTSLQPVNALTASIPTGYRAIAIRVDATSSVEGWAQAGARVDVIWVTQMTGRRTASVIAPNAKVLSANRRTEQTAQQQNQGNAEKLVPSTVTLLLSSRDALRVRLASLHGRLALVLRGSQDGGGATGSTPMNEGVLYSGLNVPAAAQKRNVVTVKVRDRKSGATEQLMFENGQRVGN
jgi:pilus assembly protein CpaB